jgi:hypothetical protein
MVVGRRLAARIVVVACCLIGAGGLGSSTATATVSQFGSRVEAAGGIGVPTGAAVDQESGDLYVVDREYARVSKFGPEGEFLFAWGWGVADREPQPETCTSLCFAGLEGEGAGEFAFPQGAAVDNDPLSLSHGDVYVADTGNQRVEKFEADGTFVLTFGDEVNQTKDEAAGATEAEKNVCAAASGDVCKGGVPGTGPGEFELESGDVVAVDASGTVYVGDDERVQEFSEGGVFEAEIKLPGAGFTRAVAVDPTGDVYVESTELPGVRKYEGCAVTCTRKELGEPRDAAGLPSTMTLGGAGELFLTDGEGTEHHILEYSAAGDQLASFDTGTPAGALAYGVAIERIYVLSEGLARLVSVPPPGPLVVSEEASETQPTTATLGAVVNPEGHEGSASEELTYHFEYGETEAYGESTATATASGGSFEDRHLAAPITALKPSTTYHFRVVATNAAGETVDGPDATFTTLPPVQIDSESVSQVSATSARLEALVNPLGAPTRYRFEYGRTTQYEEPKVPNPDGDAGEGTGDVPLAVQVEGLAPETTYHYRIVAISSLGEVMGADHTFVTQGSRQAGLLDGRDWEMVSPPDKKGISLEMSNDEGGLLQASEDGSALTYFAQAPIVEGEEQPAGNRSFAYSQLLSRREAPGSWSERDLATPHESIQGIAGGELTEYKMFSDNLSQGLVEPEGTTPLSRQATERTPYLRQDASGEYDPLVTNANVASGVKWQGTQEPGEPFSGGVQFVTGTPDLSHDLLVSPQPLTGGFESGERSSVYEWFDGQLTLVSVLPESTPTAEAELNATVGAFGHGVRNAISSDGSRVVFETEAQGVHHLWLRDLTPPAETVQIDAPEEAARNPGFSELLTYVDASSDDSKIFFLDSARLTLGSNASGSEPDLYMCEVARTAGKLTCDLKDLSRPLNQGERADVQGTAIGTDSSGHFIYYVANGALAPGATKGACEGDEVELRPEASISCNLYVTDTTTGQTKLIAVVSNLDAPDWQASHGSRDRYSELTARVSSNGRYVAFMSLRSLTGYDNRDAHSGQLDEEVFLYDRETSALTCVSCNPTGARPNGIFVPSIFTTPTPMPLVDRPGVWGNQWLSGSMSGWPLVDDFHALYEPRNLSDSGRLFFNSADGLVPQDTNGKEDVYEYEPDGVDPSCTLPAGCVALVSSGDSDEESAFVDASVGGDDAFFMTAAQLAHQDVDHALDIYDAHVCTTSAPCQGPATSTPEPCNEVASCRQAPPPQPAIFGPPATATSNSAGNVVPGAPAKPVVRPLTRAQKLAKALKTCRKKHGKAKRKCEAQAKKRYGKKAPVKHATRRRK